MSWISIEARGQAMGMISAMSSLRQVSETVHSCASSQFSYFKNSFLEKRTAVCVLDMPKYQFDLLCCK